MSHQQLDLHNNNDAIEEILENIEAVEKLEIEKQETEYKHYQSSNNSIKNIAGVAAFAFAQTLTFGDRTDIEFIDLIFIDGITLTIISLVQGFFERQMKIIQTYIGTAVYDLIIELLTFLFVLYTYIIFKHITTYFNFTRDDMPVLLIIFLFYSIFVKNLMYLSKNLKYTI